ncbi:Coenzyme F420 hydrogenase/dehydrogenase, beta subunit C-terminal domain [Clostridium arbusti]|uniref:Coenzyme F420 hydrogenase/dehydrogenase, beta subunit C-terminal domain n=1 Tax=Clostridium arbusti TaxID=1137848 RepID=UPI00028A241C|nr:Coenzyme F420 hydrogenase/dehydrogenase, beta subunit C-terminal domain [Clostridium arbusti]
MILIDETNKIECCGCTACANICPKNCINMIDDFEGFLYPKVDIDKCVNCGLCEKICPIKNKFNGRNETEAYVAQHKQKKVLDESSSGGAFSAIANYVINKGGVVFGVGYDESLNVVYKYIESIDRINLLRGSKYVQSYLGKSLNEAKCFLENGRLVCFSGTPCQIAGLKAYLGKDYNNLITIDLVCHGVPSPKLWRRYLDYHISKSHSSINEINFRMKTYGYHSGTMGIMFTNGKVYRGSARVDYMLKSFFSEISSRPSCYDCAFKTVSHNSDFTIFDCWNFSKMVPKIKDNDRGYTAILIHTKKAKNILNQLTNEIEYYKIDLNEVIKLDGKMVKRSAVPHASRKSFYEILNCKSLPKTIEETIPISATDKIIEKLKVSIYKFGMIKIAQKIKNIK